MAYGDPQVLSTEFDNLRHSSREARNLYQKNGKLIQYIELVELARH